MGHTFDIPAQRIFSLYRGIATSAHKGLLAMTRYYLHSATDQLHDKLQFTAQFTQFRRFAEKQEGFFALYRKFGIRRELVLTGESPDLTAVRGLAEKHPGSVRVTLGQMPAIVVKKPKGKQTADFLSDLLTEYIQLTAEKQ